ncbi:hypothetical protein HN682_07230 [Candidatus Peregrinibacteria bacterium]|jgi:hypothetical protein|nr:hypothetical protein [Candidatus Peregrinibacteria bacterium]
MLKILSSLNLLNRIDVESAFASTDAAVTGTWAAYDATGKLDFPTAGAKAYAIWSENRGTTAAGFSPDIDATGKLTILMGQLHAVTDQVVASGISAGDPLSVSSDGKLAVASGSEVVVGYATKIDMDGVEYYGSTFNNCIEFTTV